MFLCLLSKLHLSILHYLLLPFWEGGNELSTFKLSCTSNTCDYKSTYFWVVATFEWSQFSEDSTVVLAGFFAWLWIAGTACKCFEWDPRGNFQCEDVCVCVQTPPVDRVHILTWQAAFKFLKVYYTTLKPARAIKLWRDSGVTLLTGLEHMDKSCKDNHRIMTWLGLIFIFTANPLSPDSLRTLDCPNNCT